ncbi:hypothetical protein KY362_04055 [Candidatus Woesearchaeota archaeon]|nr:hypothetical protein [Candidatus Woesearchaeota archaeon]
MRIDANGSREDRFIKPDVRKIKEQHFRNEDGTMKKRPGGKDIKNIVISDIKRLAEDGKVVVATPSGNLDELLANEHSYDPDAVVERGLEAQDGQLLILPEQAVVAKAAAENRVVYSRESVLYLDSPEVNELLFGVRFRGCPTREQMNRHQVTPQKRLEKAIEAELIRPGPRRKLSCTGYLGTHNIPVYNSLIRWFEGYELFQHSNLAWFAANLKEIRYELRYGRTRKGRTLDKSQLRKRRLQMKMWTDSSARSQLGDRVFELDFGSFDVIKPDGKPDMDYRIQDVEVPSREYPGRWYTVELTDIGVVVKKTGKIDYSATLDTYAHCHCKDRTKRGRRRRSQHVPKDKRARILDDFHCAHIDAALLFVQQHYALNGQWGVRAPHPHALIPTPRMMHLMDNVRYNAVVVKYDNETGQCSMHRPNLTTAESIGWDAVLHLGLPATLSASTRLLRRKLHADTSTGALRFY